MRTPVYHKSQMCYTDSLFEGSTIEQEIEKATTEKQPIEGASPIIYTERKDGVLPQYDIRTDRWEIAQNAMDAVARSYYAKRAEAMKAEEKSGDPSHSTQTQQGSETPTE